MAGLGYKTFNVGDVLTAAQVQGYLQDQTVMRFASATARNTAIGANVAEGMLSYLDDTNAIQYYDGSAWQTLSTGGDITSVVAGYGLAGGGTSGDVTLTTSGGISGTNPVLNSQFNVWQRGTSIAQTAGAAYAADRWQQAGNGSPYMTMSRQLTNDTTNLPNIQYCARYQRTASNTTTTVASFSQSIETLNSIGFAGKSVVLSFYARAGANFSAASSAMGIKLTTSTTTDQNILINGGTNVFDASATLTTTWQRFTFTGTIPTNAATIAITPYYTPVGTAGANDYFEITGVQLEVGSAATAYQPNGKTYQAELAACRYYYRRWTAGSAYGTLSMFGTGLSATSGLVAVPIDSMRVAPTSVEYANVNAGDGTTSVTITGLSINQGNNNAVWLYFTTASGITQYRPYALVGSNNTAGYVGLNSEI